MKEKEWKVFLKDRRESYMIFRLFVIREYENKSERKKHDIIKKMKKNDEKLLFYYFYTNTRK